MDITISSHDNGRLTVVSIAGSLDVSGAAQIEVAMKEAVKKMCDIAVDMSGVTFLSSQGTRVLVITSKATSANTRSLYLVGPNPLVRKALVIMGIDKIIPIFNSFEEVTVHRGGKG
ncbi:MAG: STAS domain-containing protein [Rhodospirillaceae bacterium]